MKKKVTLLSLLILIALTSSAKIYIPLVKSVPPSTGNGGDARVGIRTSTYTPLAFLENKQLYIQYPVDVVSSVIITNDSTDIVVLNKNFEEASSCVQINIESFIQFQNNYNISVNAFGTWWVGYIDYLDYLSSMPGSKTSVRKGISSIANEPIERNYGAYVRAGNAISGWNFGVSGILIGNNEGTGIYGSSHYDEGFNTYGRYAGLFHGDLKTTDAVYASVYNTLADSRLNYNCEQMKNGTLDNIMQMNVYKYGLKQFDVDNGNESTQLEFFNDDSGILEKDHFGLSGQEIKELYPNLVSESQDGYLSINYIEIIPLLIQSIQELKNELDALKTTTNVQNRVAYSDVYLLQSTPNPFKEKCIIKCNIPQTVNEATLIIYDYNGRQILSRKIFDRGNIQIVIDNADLEAGIYMYSLIVDGTLVDTKRLVHVE